MSATFEKLKEALIRVSGRELGLLEPSTPLLELGLDSISMADLALVLEEDFGTTLELQDMALLQTLGDLVARLDAGR